MLLVPALAIQAALFLALGPPPSVAAVDPLPLGNQPHHRSLRLAGGTFGKSDTAPTPAPPSPVSRVFVACGNKNSQSCVTPTLEAAVDEEHEVRCCSDASLGNGWEKNSGCSVWSESEIGGSCFSEKTFAFAKDKCESVGARLCTLDEMTSNCSSRTGCFFDYEMVWTGTPVPCTDDASCDDGLQCTTNTCDADGVCRSERVPGCPLQIIVGGSSAGDWPRPRVKPADAGELHDVRCCSDTAKSGWVKKNNNNCAVWGESNLPVCNRNKNLADAAAICDGQGARLCTQKEIEDDCTRGSGCSFDHQHVWTSTPYTEGTTI